MPSNKYSEQTIEELKTLLSLKDKKIVELTSVINQLPGDIYWKNAEGCWLGVNNNGLKNMHRMGFNLDIENIIGKNDEVFFPRETAAMFRKNDLHVMETGQTIAYEETQHLSTGETIVQLSTKCPLYDNDNNVIGIVGNTIDITHLKSIEKELRTSQARAQQSDSAKSDFIANMSHDLRIPITGILGLLHALIHAAKQAQAVTHSALTENPDLAATINTLQTHLNDLSETVLSEGELVLGATQQLLELCNDMLAAVRLQNGVQKEEPSIFCPSALAKKIQSLLQPVANQKGLSLNIELGKLSPAVKGQRLQLERALLNLVSNALKFTHQGRVVIRLHQVPEPKKGEATQPGQAIVLHLQVQDNGIGIEQDQLSHIFEPFTRLNLACEGKYEGSGLGLFTVQRAIDALEGTISVESTVGQGSCFTLSVPLKVEHPQEQAQAASSSPVQAPIHTNGQPSVRRVLLVEDNPVAARALSFLLKSLHCEVNIAGSGAEAVAMAQATPYSMIFMDIGLPDFNGIIATEKIRQGTHPQPPIIALTGHANDPSTREAAMAAGMQAVLDKPTDLDKLTALLTQYTAANTST